MECRGLARPLSLIYELKFNRIMATALPKAFFLEYGERIGVEPALLKAVQLVESGSYDGFLKSGKVQILFEGHIFYKLISEVHGPSMAKKIASEYPNICYPKWDRTKYLGGEKEWNRLEKARSIFSDQDLANQSASWGMFQIMGFNYKLCGCESVNQFVELMANSREDQFILGVNFMQNSGCLKYLVNHEWAKFAKAYNGPGYTQNKYDTKLENAYKKATNDF